MTSFVLQILTGDAVGVQLNFLRRAGGDDPAAGLTAADEMLYPENRSLRQKRDTVASATSQASASSEMDMNWVFCW